MAGGSIYNGESVRATTIVASGVIDGGQVLQGGNPVMPRGGIIVWSGTLGNIPGGWALCDGANGTPDLRDRFVYGAGREEEVGRAGNVAYGGPVAFLTLAFIMKL